MKILTAVLVLLAAAILPSFAQEDAETTMCSAPCESNVEMAPKLRIAFDARIDFDVNDIEGEGSKAGFHGRYLNFILSGNITPQLSYMFRQRLNKFGDFKNDVFSATDMIYLTWQPNEHWSISGGKQVVAVGGYEYDANPIDIYFASLYWNNIACYQFGVSASYTFTGGNHTLMAQFCNSPYQPLGKTCFAYNVMWTGRMGCFSTLWSVNAMEYKRGKFASVISLGNRWDFKPAYFELDLMNRYAPHQRFLLDNYTVIGRVGASIGRHVDVFVKGGYEKYKLELDDATAISNPFVGGGVEYYPLKNDRRLRLDLVADMYHNNDGKRVCQAQLGVTWKMDVFKLKPKKK